MSKVIGIVSAPSINGTNYELSKITIKLEQEGITYVAMGDTAGWKTEIPGGAKQVSGSFEGAADTTLLSGSFIPPFSDSTTATFSITLGSFTIGFAAVINDVEVDKSNTGLVTIKGNYKSSGTVTF